jgi:hypothetical protein
MERKPVGLAKVAGIDRENVIFSMPAGRVPNAVRLPLCNLQDALIEYNASISRGFVKREPEE